MTVKSRDDEAVLIARIMKDYGAASAADVEKLVSIILQTRAKPIKFNCSECEGEVLTFDRKRRTCAHPICRKERNKKKIKSWIDSGKAAEIRKAKQDDWGFVGCKVGMSRSNKEDNL